jgi:hypothetical protein
MRNLLRPLKSRVASGMKSALVAAPMPLDIQAAAIRTLLPMDPWPKSLAYQQCLANRVLSKYGAVTQAGPFKGMVCIQDAAEGCLVPKLLGCYEEELAGVAESLMTRPFDRIIDVGCASGYWLTGFAMRLPHVHAVGFDIADAPRARCRQLSVLNNVQSRMDLFGACSVADLQALAGDRTLVFMDCDGPEYELLDPDLAPALRRADIVVECHDYLNPLITPTLMHRFEGSHHIEKISSRVRQPNLTQYPGLAALPPRHWAAALDERRPCVQDWLIMRPKHVPRVQ